MAPGSKKRAGVADDFIVSDDDDHLQPKRARTNATKKSNVSGTSQSHSSTTSKVDANGDRYWEISRMRRVTVSSFRGRTMVNIREYYEKDGQELPGKKGISLPMEQFAALIDLLPELEVVLKENGQSVPRPDYAGPLTQKLDESSEGNSESSIRKPAKKNIEATSDEEESDDE